GDPVAILDAVDRAAMAGRDMRQVVRDLVGVFRDALLHRFAARGRPPASLPAGPPGWPERLLTACEPLSDDDLVAALEELGRLEQDLRWAPRPRLGLEVALLRLARRRNAVMGTDGARPATGTAVPAGNDPAHSTAPPAAAASVTAAGAETPRPPRPVPPKRPPANGSGGSPTADAPLPTLADVQRLWPQVLAVVRSRRRPTAALLEPARPVAVEGSTLVLAFARTYEFHRNRMAEPKNLQVLEVALREILGHDLRVSCRRGDDDTPIGGHILPPLEAPRGNDEAEVARNLFGGEWIEEGDATS
ncbi:MAG: hypothetical protein IRY95_09510, partial [Clostridia bacterium]|nr:hypothetical protein [Clostridia bacterium]